MWKALRNHRVVATIISAAVIVSAIAAFLAALAQIWTAFSHDTVPDFLAKQRWSVALPPWQAILLASIGVIVVVCQMAILWELYQQDGTPSPYPTMMFFTHDSALARNSTLALQARDLFEKAGW